MMLAYWPHHMLLVGAAGRAATGVWGGDVTVLLSSRCKHTVCRHFRWRTCSSRCSNSHVVAV